MESQEAPIQSQGSKKTSTPRREKGISIAQLKAKKGVGLKKETKKGWESTEARFAGIRRRCLQQDLVRR